MRLWILTCLVFVTACLAVPAWAQNRDVPYWASIRTDEAYMRVGPSGDYKIAWVYRRKGLPMKVLRVVEGWRLLEDADGTQGWVAQSQLVLSRTAVVIGDGKAAMRDIPGSGGKLRWYLETGVIGALGDCQSGFCELNVNGHKGWVEQSRLWGAGEP